MRLRSCRWTKAAAPTRVRSRRLIDAAAADNDCGSGIHPQGKRGLDAIEQAIRNAFAKGNPEDPAFREKVYRSASAALEKAFQANRSITVETAERRRKGLLATVSSIESEFIPAVKPVPPPPQAPPVAADPPVQAPVRRPALPADPVLDPPMRPEAPAAARREPAFPEVDRRSDWPSVSESETAAGRVRLAGDEQDRPAGYEAEPVAERRRRPWGLIAGLLILLMVAALALWTAAELGFLKLGGEASVPAETAEAGSGDDGAPRRPGEEVALENWVTVFSPSDPTTVTAPGGATAEVADSGGEQVMRIGSGPAGAAIVFDVGQGVLERIAGKRAVFDIVARAGEGRETQMSVSCSFGDLGDCGRNRYQVGSERSEFLFEIDIPAKAPGAAGSIAIVTDVSDKGNPVEIYEIRVTTAE